MIRVAAVLVVALLAWPQTVTFRSDVNLLSVQVRVTDHRGRIVRGLERDAFRLEEDGIRQPIAFLQEQEQPLSLGILIDASSSMSGSRKLHQAKSALRMLTSAVNGASEILYAEFASTLGKFIEVKDVDEGLPESNVLPVAGPSGTALYDAIAVALCRLQNSRYAKRALVVITDGADQHSRLKLDQLIEFLKTTDTRVYIIGSFTDEELDLYQHQSESVTLVTGRSIDNPVHAFRQLAQESGAESYFPVTTAQLTRAVEAVLRDLQSYYTIGYYVQPTTRHTRNVRVKLLDSRLKIKAREVFSTDPSGVHFQSETCAISIADHPYPYERKLSTREGLNLYSEDFADPRSGWPSRESSWYGNREYHLLRQPGTGARVDSGTIAAQGPSWKNLRASIEVKQSSVPDRDGSLLTLPAAGLIFRLTDVGYYTLLVTRVGRGVQAKLVANRFRGSPKDLTPWTEAGESGEWTRLAIECRGANISLYVNGSLAGRIVDTTFGFGHVGMAQFGLGHAVFRDLLVQELPSETRAER
jgi:Ca-activated chloride channel family protein